MSTGPKRPKLGLKDNPPSESRVMKKVEDLFAPHLLALRTIVSFQKPAPSRRETDVSKREQSTAATGTKETRTIPDPSVITEAGLQPEPKKKAKSKRNKLESSRALLAALILIGALTGWMLNSSVESAAHRDAVAQRQLEQQRLRERAEFHRVQTGQKLNRERIGVEIENTRTAPPIPSGARHASRPSMMSGLPLAPEGYHQKSERDRQLAVDSDYADARIAYSVKEEREAADWEAEAQRVYIQEFIANAERAGLKVTIDKNGVARVVKRRPDSVTKEAGTAQGSVR